MAISAYLSDILTRHFFLGETLTSPLDINTFNYWERCPWLGVVHDHAASPGDNWIEVDRLTHTEYFRTNIAFAYNDPNAYLYNPAPHYVPRATSDWGTVKGVVIWDADGIHTGGDVLFDLPWTTDGTTITPSLTITAGKMISFDWWGIILAFRGKEPNSLTNGGMSVEYTRKVLQWIAGLITVPIAERTYDMAIGRSASYDSFEKFSSWTECSGTGYQRIAMSASDWEQPGGYYGVTNAHEVTFTNSAPSAWGYIEDIVLYATDTDTPAFWGHLSTPVTVNSGDGFSIGSNQLAITWEGRSIS